MKVVAKAKGQYKGRMFYPGDIFEFDEKDKSNPRAPWMGDTVPVQVQSNILPKLEEKNPESQDNPDQEEQGG